MLTMKTYASVAGGETGSIWIVSAPPALGAADRAVLLVHPVRHRDEHLGRLASPAGSSMSYASVMGPRSNLSICRRRPASRGIPEVVALRRQRLDRDKLAAAASNLASAMTATIANVTCGEMLDVASAGDGELVETVRALRDDGFDGFFSLEPHLGE
jgi:hypothetical protein